MFNFFKKKTELEKLQDQYQKLQEESYKLSHRDRKQSDLKMAEAEAVLRRIEEMKKSEK